MTKRDVGMPRAVLPGHHPPPLVPLNTVPAQHTLVTPRALRVLEVMA